jgi:hypothetical protein
MPHLADTQVISLLPLQDQELLLLFSALMRHSELAGERDQYGTDEGGVGKDQEQHLVTIARWAFASPLKSRLNCLCIT